MFWTTFGTLCALTNRMQHAAKSDKEAREHVTVARIAALMQMLALPNRRNCGSGWSSISRRCSTPRRHGDRVALAIFSAGRRSAIRRRSIRSRVCREEGLHRHSRERHFQQPWPCVSANRAADTIARTGRTDLIPELLAVLDEGRIRGYRGRRMAGRTEATRGKARDGEGESPPQLHGCATRHPAPA